MEMQQTISEPVSISGPGLFYGKMVNMTFRPAPPDHGVVFQRTDLPEQPHIEALVENVTKADRHTMLRQGSATIETCEHCMSALHALGVDNVLIEIDSAELPALDGSAAPFADLIRSSGLQRQDKPREIFIVEESVTVRSGEAEITVEPCKNVFHVVYELDYGESSPLGKQVYSYTLNAQSYLEEIAPARTFSHEHEAIALWNHGLCRHLTPADVLVIGPDGPIDNQFRFEKEPARHKILDLIGDFYLFGGQIQGKVTARRSGHALNHEMVRVLRKYTH